MSDPKVRPGRLQIDENTEIEDVDLNETEIIVDGERLTDQRAEQIAADVLAKARAHNLVPGGKSLSGEGKHSPVIQTRVSETTKAELARIAERRKMSVSKLSRQILDEYVSQHSA